MKARYSAEARLEFLRAVAYLEEQRDRLGVEFAMAVREGIREIVAHPFRWPELKGRAALPAPAIRLRDRLYDRCR